MKNLTIYALMGKNVLGEWYLHYPKTHEPSSSIVELEGGLPDPLPLKRGQREVWVRLDPDPALSPCLLLGRNEQQGLEALAKALLARVPGWYTQELIMNIIDRRPLWAAAARAILSGETHINLGNETPQVERKRDEPDECFELSEAEKALLATPDE